MSPPALPHPTARWRLTYLRTLAALVVLAASLLVAAPAKAAPACGVLASGAAPQAQTAIHHACSQLGVPYVWGGGHGSSPGATGGGFDCSGLVRYAYARATGRDILGAGSTRAQWARAQAEGWPRVFSWSAMLPGDLIYYSDNGTAAGIYHVAMYLGQNAIVEAPSPGLTVRTRAQSGSSDFIGAVRIFTSPGAQPAGAGPMFHQVRAANGSWSGFGALNGYQTPLPGDAKDVAVAGLADGTAQVVIVGADNRIYHRGRHANGTWTEFQPLNGMGTTSPAQGKRVAIAALPNGTTQVVMIGTDDTVYHRVRNTDGNWTGWGRLNGYGTTSAAGARDVAISGQPDNSAQVLIVGMDDGIYHRGRHADGTWTEFRPLTGTGTTTTAKGSAVAIAGLPDGSSQVVIAGSGGQLHHRIRQANGSWSEFQPLNGAGTSTPAVAKDVTVAGLPNGTSQVTIVGADNQIHHRVRAATGAWSEFRTVAGVGTSSGAKGSRVSMAGLPDNSTQLVIVGE